MDRRSIYRPFGSDLVPISHTMDSPPKTTNHGAWRNGRRTTFEAAIRMAAINPINCRGESMIMSIEQKLTTADRTLLSSPAFIGKPSKTLKAKVPETTFLLVSQHAPAATDPRVPQRTETPHHLDTNGPNDVDGEISTSTFPAPSFSTSTKPSELF